jgi:hypothetical protein
VIRISDIKDFTARDVDRKEIMGRRARFIALAVATIVLGLLVHLRGAMLDFEMRDALGDALWAAMIAWWWVRWLSVRNWQLGALLPTRSV